MRLISRLALPLVLIVALLSVGAALLTYTAVRQVVGDSPIILPPPPQFGVNAATVAPLFGPTSVPVATLASKSSTQAANAVDANGTPASVPTYSDPGRVSILLLGIDQRKGEKGPFRTDTIIVLSIDPIRKTAAMLSIPRDIYIPIPGFNRADRINNANATGEIAQYPGGGPALAVKTVQSLIGVPIQRYMMINFDVFDTVIDAIGPIQVCPTEAIHDDQYPDGSYGYITVDFKPGCQNLDSTKLLEYARVRHNAGDDFGRASRQQEVIKSVRDKVLSLGGISALISKIGPIWDSLKGSVVTDMTFNEMLELAQLGQGIPKENIQSAVMTDKDGYLIPSTLADGEQVFTPVYEKIHSLMDTLFSAAPGNGAVVVAAPAATGAAVVAAQPAPSVGQENAAILVSNGAGIDGMAKATADKLRTKGFNIVDAKNADLPGGYGKTIIRVYTNKVQTARALADALGLDGTVIASETNGPAGIDIEVVVGKDMAAVATPP
jgi:polyisoprenyl-teichoic acid--peptidoglycan teichoic acid transferase